MKAAPDVTNLPDLSQTESCRYPGIVIIRLIGDFQVQ